MLVHISCRKVPSWGIADGVLVFSPIMVSRGAQLQEVAQGRSASPSPMLSNVCADIDFVFRITTGTPKLSAPGLPFIRFLALPFVNLPNGAFKTLGRSLPLHFVICSGKSLSRSLVC